MEFSKETLWNDIVPFSHLYPTGSTSTFNPKIAQPFQSFHFIPNHILNPLQGVLLSVVLALPQAHTSFHHSLGLRNL
jgi:hypothetical protein